MKVFLTGGSGLIGSHAAERLSAGGAEVVCLQRPASDTRFLRKLGCRIVQGDVRDDPDDLAVAMEGCEALIHCAAVIYADRPWPKIRAVNVEGTDRVLAAGARAGVTRAVHLSSVAVYGDARAPVDENTSRTTPLRPTDLYARSKREAEDVAARRHGHGGLAVTVLRPAAVYGERDRLFAPRMAGALRWPLTPLLGTGGNTLPVVYAGNVAEAIHLAVDADAAEGRAYNVASDGPVTQRRFLEGLAQGMGVRPRFVPVPAGLVRWAAHLGELVGISIPEARDLGLRRAARLATVDNPFRSTRAKAELGWDPPVPIPEALERTGRWLAAPGDGGEDGG